MNFSTWSKHVIFHAYGSIVGSISELNISLSLGDELTTYTSWRRHQMETFSALLALCAGNSPVHGEFPTQRPVTRSFDVFFDLRLNKRLSKQPWGWWFETPAWSLWRHRNVTDLSQTSKVVSFGEWICNSTPHSTLYNVRNFLSMMRLKLIHVSNRGPQYK